MAFRFRHHARQRAVLAGIVGVIIIVLFGPQLMIPAIALVAFVYYAHQMAAVVVGDDEVPNPSLAFVVVINTLVVLLVKVLVFFSGLQTRI